MQIKMKRAGSKRYKTAITAEKIKWCMYILAMTVCFCEHIDSYPLYASPLHGGENEDNNYCQGKFNFQLTFHMAISITCFKVYVYFYMYQYCTN